MQTISARGTFFFKRVFPTFWFGFLTFFLLTALLSGAFTKAPAFLAVPVLLGVFGYFLMRHLVFDLVDEVLDGGDHLVIRRSGTEIQLRLVDILRISTALRQNPPRVTLHLSAPSEFGTEIAFMATKDATWNLFSVSCAAADDLSRRVDAARRSPAGGAPTPVEG